MNKRLYKYLIENNILYSKRIDFQNGLSTDHAAVQLFGRIIEFFEKDSTPFFSKNWSYMVKRTEIIDGLRATSQIGDNSFKSMEKKRQA